MSFIGISSKMSNMQSFEKFSPLLLHYRLAIGQAAIERGFSINIKLSMENLQKSLVASRLYTQVSTEVILILVKFSLPPD